MPDCCLNASRVGDCVSLPFMSRYAVQLAQLRTFSLSETSVGRSRLAVPLAAGGSGGAHPASVSPAPAATPLPSSARRLSPPEAAAVRAAAGGDRGRRPRRGMGLIGASPPVRPRVVLVCWPWWSGWAWSWSSGRRRSALDVGHDVLDAGVVLEPVHREVLAVPGLLVATVRHLRDQRDVGVDPHAAEVERLRHPHRPTEVLGPHRRREAVVDAVGPPERLLLVGEPLDRDDGAEDLVLDRLVVLS